MSGAEVRVYSPTSPTPAFMPNGALVSVPSVPLPGRAEYRVGQINKALYRNVRFICAIGMHTQEMKVEDCETLFREQAYQDPGNARQQAARGTYDPGYLNYTLGKLMIRKLREDWTKSRGGQKAWKEFHDSFLSFGGPPVPMIRARMLGEDAGAAL